MIGDSVHGTVFYGLGTGTPRYQRFEEWLQSQGKRLTAQQASFAKALLSWPVGSGISFLIEHLAKFDESTKGDGQ